MMEDENVAVPSTQEEENLVTMTDELEEPEANPPTIDDQGEAVFEMPTLSSSEAPTPSASANTIAAEDDKGLAETPTSEAKSEESLVAQLSEGKVVPAKPVEREGHCYW